MAKSYKERLAQAIKEGLTPAMFRGSATLEDYLNHEAFSDYGHANAYWVNLIADAMQEAEAMEEPIPSRTRTAANALIRLEERRLTHKVQWKDQGRNWKILLNWRDWYFQNDSKTFTKGKRRS